MNLSRSHGLQLGVKEKLSLVHYSSRKREAWWLDDRALRSSLGWQSDLRWGSSERYKRAPWCDGGSHLTAGDGPKALLFLHHKVKLEIWTLYIS